MAALFAIYSTLYVIHYKKNWGRKLRMGTSAFCFSSSWARSWREYFLNKLQKYFFCATKMFLNNRIVEYFMRNIEYLWGIMLLLWHNPKSLNMNGKEKLICGDHSPSKNTHIGCYRSYKMFGQCLVIPQIVAKPHEGAPYHLWSY